jgi:hypothetical protein
MAPVIATGHMRFDIHFPSLASLDLKGTAANGGHKAFEQAYSHSIIAVMNADLASEHDGRSSTY